MGLVLTLPLPSGQMLIFGNCLILLSQKVAGDCHWESVIEGDSHFSI
jgi:hypothetical protein